MIKYVIKSSGFASPSHPSNDNRLWSIKIRFDFSKYRSRFDHICLFYIR